MTDIRKFAVEETSIIELLDANELPMIGDDKKPMTITVWGPGSREYARAQAAQSNRVIDKIKRKGKTNETAEDKAREQAEFLAGCTKEFSDNIEYDDLKGAALFKAVYSDADIGFIAEQVAKHLGEWSNFTKESPTS